MMTLWRWVARHLVRTAPVTEVHYNRNRDPDVRALRLEGRQAERRTRQAERHLRQIQNLPIESDVFPDRPIRKDRP